MSTVHTFTTKNYNVILSRSQLSVCVISRNLTEITSQLLNKTNHLLAFAHIHTHTTHKKRRKKVKKPFSERVVNVLIKPIYIQHVYVCVLLTYYATDIIHLC